MENIIEYVEEYGQFSLEERPFNEVDSLVLCQLSYLNFIPFVPGLEKHNPPISIQNIYEQGRMPELLEGYWFKDENEALFRATVHSVRFREMKLNYHVNIINEDSETQFSAITYVLPDKSVYVAYRGTDATLIGWKEDLNLALSKPAHSQELALEYIIKVSEYIAGDFLLGGHSKGGNLAVYAAMCCEESIQNQITRIYNHDGPGFRPEIFSQGQYEKIANKVMKYIPKSSIVGMIMEDREDYVLVESKSIGLMQHNSYFWKVEEDHFARVNNVTAGKKFRDEAMNQWILSLSQEQLQSFADTLYEVVSASEATDLFEFGGDLKKSLSGMYEALKEVDEDTKQSIQTIMHTLFEIAGEKFHTEFHEKIREFQKKIVDRTRKKR